MSRFSSNAANASITAALSTINAGKDDTKISTTAISSVPSSLLPLLPSTATDFHSKAYWDNFFKERGSKPFEWYGEYSNFSHFIHQYAPSFKESFLVIGCGNSEFSSTLYDAKYTNITNIDFSPILIQEMMAKNNLKRPYMKWLVSDMTDLKSVVADDSFNNVFDKGALDALFSEDTTEMRLLVNNMFKEIDRVLFSPSSSSVSPSTASTTNTSTTAKSTSVSGGKYMCITLAQDFIIKTLLQFFSTDSSLSSLYSVVIDIVTNSRSSPKIPFFVCLAKVDNKNDIIDINTNSSHKGSSGSTLLTPTTAAVGIATAAAEKGLIGVRFNSFGNAIKTTSFITLEETLKLIKSVQEFHDQIYGLGDIQIDRFESMDFWCEQSGSNNKIEVAAMSQVPRFTITILDTDKRPKTRTCAVFIVPVGRESEYQFNTKNGVHDIAMQAECNRLFAVRLNKPHTFQNMTSLQEELSPIILTLIPHRGKLESIPYMSLAQENEWKEVKFGFTVVSGDYIIEEKPAADENESGSSASNNCAIIRRLIFLQNQNFIQTECRLLLKEIVNTNNINNNTVTIDDDKAAMTKSKLKRMKKKQSDDRKINNNNSAAKNINGEDNEIKINTNINTDTNTIKGDEIIIDVDQSSSRQISSSPYKFDLTYVDDHHRAMLSAFSLLLSSTTYNKNTRASSNSNGNVNNSSGNNSSTFSATVTSTVTSATSTTANNVTTVVQSVPQWRGLLVGLGGGSLPMCLQHFFPDTYLTIVELDDQIEAIATEFFGFEKLRGVKSSDGKVSGTMEVVVQDGVDYIANHANQVKMNDFCTNSTVADNGDVDGGISKILKSLSITATRESTTQTGNIHSQPPQSSSPLLSYIIIDVDGKDNSLGLTAPPLAFIHPSVLTQMYTCLLPGGVLIFNVVARGGDAPINALIQQVKLVFCCDTGGCYSNRDGNNIHKKNDNTEANTEINNRSNAAVYLIRPSETTVNVVLIAQKEGSITVSVDNIITSAAVDINANISTSVSTENDNNEENDDVDEKEDDGEIVNGETTTVTTATTNTVANSKKNRIKKKKAKKKASNVNNINNSSSSQPVNMSSSCNSTTEGNYKNMLQQYLIQHHQKFNQNSSSNSKSSSNSTNAAIIDPLSLLSFIDNLERV